MQLRPALLLLALAPAACRTQSSTAAMSRAAIAPVSGGSMPSGELPRTHAPRPTEAAITPADLMTRLYIFADDSMQGRETGTEGNLRGLRYIEGELRRLGLTPMGENGGYRQAVPLVKRGFSDSYTATVNGRSLKAWEDVVPVPARGGVPRSLNGAAFVYAGSVEEAGRLTEAQVRGKIVVVRTTGVRLPPVRSLAEAAGVGLYLGQPLPAQFIGFFRAGGVSTPSTGGATVREVPQPVVLSPAALQAAFGAGVESLTSGQVGGTLTTTLTFSETPIQAYNLVAVIPGSDPALKGQYVAIGAHNDHVGFSGSPVDHDSLKAFNRTAWTMAGAYAGLPPLSADKRATIRVNVDSLRRLRPARPDSINNGADDDGSGSMAVLEIAENMARARVKPKRSLIFVWHTGEEKGLLGAQWFTEHPTVTRDSIIAQVNIDMIGRGDSVDVKGGGPRYVGVVGHRRLSSMLGDMVDSIARAGNIALDYRLDADGHPENIYCRSDHYMYARYGIPVAFFFTGLHGDYHQVTDEPQYIDYPHYSLLTNYIRDLTVRVANGPRPVVDKPKPTDPNAPCRQ